MPPAKRNAISCVSSGPRIVRRDRGCVPLIVGIIRYAQAKVIFHPSRIVDVTPVVTSIIGGGVHFDAPFVGHALRCDGNRTASVRPGVPLLLIAVVAVASCVPAQAATKNPLVALRDE